MEAYCTLNISGSHYDFKIDVTKKTMTDNATEDDIIDDLHLELYKLKFDESVDSDYETDSGSEISDSDASSLTISSSTDSNYEKLKDGIIKEALVKELNNIKPIPIDECMHNFIDHEDKQFADWFSGNLKNYILHEVTLLKEEFIQNLIGFAYKYQYNPLSEKPKENIIWFVYGRDKVAAYILAKHSNFHFNKNNAKVKKIAKTELPTKSTLFTLVDDVYL